MTTNDVGATYAAASGARPAPLSEKARNDIARTAATLRQPGTYQPRIEDGRCAYAKPHLSLYDGDRMIAALIDAEAYLYDYTQFAGDEAPKGLWPTLYKVRDAIRACEDANARVSVRTGAQT